MYIAIDSEMRGADQRASQLPIHCVKVCELAKILMVRAYNLMPYH